jgi:hypothetical protein
MSKFDEQPSKETRKRDWLDWAQGSVALLTALLAVWINFQQQGLKSQQDKIDLTLKKESTTTLFTDKILQQLNAVTEENSKVIKGAIVLELMGLDIQAHLVSRTGDDKQLTELEEDCRQIPSRIALFTANVDALDVSDEAKWVQYAYDTDNRIARHTALVALGMKALQTPPLSAEDSLPSNSAVHDPTLDVLTSRLREILKLSDNLESPDLAIDALDAISRLGERCHDLASQLKGNETLGLVLKGMRNLETRLNPQHSNVALHRLKQPSKELEHQLHDQLTHLDSTWNILITARFCGENDRRLAPAVTAKR